MAGVAPRFQQYAGDDPLADVVSWNLKRRQLTTSQKAALAVALKPMFDEQARDRQREHGNTAPGRPAENTPRKFALSEGKASEQVAATVGVSARIVEDAESVKESAPEIFEEVKAGRLTVNAAKQEVKRREADGKRTGSGFPTDYFSPWGVYPFCTPFQAPKGDRGDKRGQAVKRNTRKPEKAVFIGLFCCSGGVLQGKRVVARVGIEPTTRGFSVRCSTS